MIIRSLLLRHGRVALPKPSYPLRASRRYQSTIESTQASPQASQVHIAGGIGGTKSQAVASAGQPTPPAEVDPVLADWTFFQHQKKHTSKIGTELSAHYKPHDLLSHPPRPQDITLELLLASQAHIGHSTSLWHPANAKYIFGVRGGKGEDAIHIISLDVTAAYLRRACKVVHGVVERGGLVLFVGSRPGQERAVVNAAKMARGCHLFTKWTPGSITNGQQILGKCKKKVVDSRDRTVEGFDDQLLHKAVVKPDLVVCLNPLENYVLLRECAMNGIPTIGVVDTDVNPTWVTYPIPANDDSWRSIHVIAGVLGNAGKEGFEERLAGGAMTSPRDHGLESPRPKEEGEEEQTVSSQESKTLLQQAEQYEEPAVGAEDEGEEVSNISSEDLLAFAGEKDAASLEKPEVPYERDAPIEGGADSFRPSQGKR